MQYKNYNKSDSVLAANLRALRGSRTKAEFAKILGIKPQTYQNYEDGRPARQEQLEKISRAIGVSVDELINDKSLPERIDPPREQKDNEEDEFVFGEMRGKVCKGIKELSNEKLMEALDDRWNTLKRDGYDSPPGNSHFFAELLLEFHKRSLDRWLRRIGRR